MERGSVHQILGGALAAALHASSAAAAEDGAYRLRPAGSDIHVIDAAGHLIARLPVPVPARGASARESSCALLNAAGKLPFSLSRLPQTSAWVGDAGGASLPAAGRLLHLSCSPGGETTYDVSRPARPTPATHRPPGPGAPDDRTDGGKLIVLGAGASYRFALGRSFPGAAAELQVGGEGRHVGGGGRLRLEAGETSTGLPFVWFSAASGGLWGRIGRRVRLGFDGNLGLLTIVGMTSRSSAITAALQGDCSVELYRGREGGAWVAGLLGGLEILFPVDGPGPLSFAGRLLVGYRY